jgi:hypothetical protein
MRPVIFKCPLWTFALLALGAAATFGIIPVVRVERWPPSVAWVLIGVALFLFLYALTLLPTRLVISDEGIYQRLLFSESRLRWEDMVEFRHCDGGAEFEEGELRAQTLGKWHTMEFWIKDKAGRKHHFKSWLVFGKRSRQIADILRERGIGGG